MAYREITVKSVLNKHRKRDPWFLDEYSINPYSGCSFNCIYCYIYGSKYGGKDRGVISVKMNAPEVLEKQINLRARKAQYGFIALSSSTEPYMNIEKRYKLTRRILEIILKYRFPVHVLTKSTLVVRDFDLILKIAESAILPDDICVREGAFLTVSISTLNGALAKKIEPGAPSPAERLKIVEKARAYGIKSGIAFIPIIPFLSDSEDAMNDMLSAAEEVHADYLFIGTLTLFGKSSHDSKMSFYRFLERFHPELLTEYRKMYKIFPAPPEDYSRRLYKMWENEANKRGLHTGLPGCKI